MPRILLAPYLLAVQNIEPKKGLCLCGVIGGLLGAQPFWSGQDCVFLSSIIESVPAPKGFNGHTVGHAAPTSRLSSNRNGCYRYCID
jgi:hypothetical protein